MGHVVEARALPLDLPLQGTSLGLRVRVVRCMPVQNEYNNRLQLKQKKRGKSNICNSAIALVQSQLRKPTDPQQPTARRCRAASNCLTPDATKQVVGQPSSADVLAAALKLKMHHSSRHPSCKRKSFFGTERNRKRDKQHASVQIRRSAGPFVQGNTCALMQVPACMQSAASLAALPACLLCSMLQHRATVGLAQTEEEKKEHIKERQSGSITIATDTSKPQPSAGSCWTVQLAPPVCAANWGWRHHPAPASCWGCAARPQAPSVHPQTTSASHPRLCQHAAGGPTGAHLHCSAAAASERGGGRGAAAGGSI